MSLEMPVKSGTRILKVAQLLAEVTPLKLYFSDIRKIAFIIYVHSKRERLFATEVQSNKIEYFLEKSISLNSLATNDLI